MGADKSEADGHGKVPRWLLLLWAGFLIWILVYIITGLATPLR